MKNFLMTYVIPTSRRDWISIAVLTAFVTVLNNLAYNQGMQAGKDRLLDDLRHFNSLDKELHPGTYEAVTLCVEERLGLTRE